MAELDNGLLIAYLSILIMSVASIVIGSFRSLQITKRPDVLSTKDAAMFPVMGSFVLFGLYILFQYFDKELINYMLSGYFLFLGVIAVGQTFHPFLVYFCPTEYEKTSIRVEWYDGTKGPELTGVDLVGAVFGALIAAWYSYTKFWIANNIFGLSFAITAIEYMSLGGFKVAAILLCGLFVYDIFWVFGTDVMVTVAKSVDHPIKLVFPKSGFFATDFSMIGLGDLVLPGILIAMLLRFDRKRGTGGNVYFNVCMTAYTLGLITTVVVMHTFQAAQPALLYLVPATLGSTLLLAYKRGEISKLMEYSEELSPSDNNNDGKGEKASPSSDNNNDGKEKVA